MCSTCLRKQPTISARIEIPLLLPPLAGMMKRKGIQQAGANNDVNMEDNDDDNDVDRQSLQGGGGNPK